MNVMEVIRKRRIKWKPRCVGSRSILLILMLGFIASCSISFSLQKNIYTSVQISSQEIFYIGVAVFSFSLPISSVLAEVLISRYKLVSYSLKIVWLLSVIDCIISLCGGSFYASGIIAILKLILLGGFLTGALPLGIDQLITGSHHNISSFLQWLVWVYFAAFTSSNLIGSVAHKCTSMEDNVSDNILALLQITLLSLGLIMDFMFHGKLVKEPVSKNPIRLIFRVLKYAAKHKHPVMRSAFTYCENELPSRLDYAKTKYGGPFTTEEVEDVKTFWRIVIVILVISTLAIPLIALLSIPYSKQWPSCKQGLLLEVSEPYLFIMFFIPLYELLVHPWLGDRGPRILCCIRIVATALIVSSLFGLATEIVFFITNGSTQCLFSQTVSCLFTYIPFNYILGFALATVSKTSFQFICAQAPYNMRGLLTGFWCTAWALFTVPGILMSGGWQRWMVPLDSRYGIWFFLLMLLIETMITMALSYVIRWYKSRERDDVRSSRIMVEDIYYKYAEQEEQSLLSH